MHRSCSRISSASIERRGRWPPGSTTAGTTSRSPASAGTRRRHSSCATFARLRPTTATSRCARSTSDRSRAHTRANRSVAASASLARAVLRHPHAAWDVQGTRRAKLVLANSRYTAGYVKRVYDVDAVVNYAGVDADAFTPGDEPHERFVLTVGELMPRKGFDWAVRTVGAMPTQNRPPLVIVSNNVDAAERRYVEGVASECGVALDVRERASDAELKRLYRTAGVFLYTPHLEPLGLAPLEAMASGTPVVAVREAGPAETVSDGVTGVPVRAPRRRVGGSGISSARGRRASPADGRRRARGRRETMDVRQVRRGAGGAARR